MKKLHLAGELTIYRAGSLKVELVDAMRDSGELELDLGAVEAIDTAALQLLLLVKREMAAKGGKLVLVNHSAPVVEAIDLYGLSAHFGDPVLIRDAGGGRD